MRGETEQKQSSRILPAPARTKPTPLSTSPTRMMRLLQQLDLHEHIIIPLSP